MEDHSSHVDMLSQLRAMEELAKTTFWGYLGCELVELNEHEAVVKLDVKPHHLNMLGIVHGGVTSALLDNTMGLVAIAARPNLEIVTSNLNIHYVSPLNGGTLEVRAQIIHASKKTLTCYGTVTDGDGQVGTIGTGTFRAKR